MKIKKMLWFSACATPTMGGFPCRGPECLKSDGMLNPTHHLAKGTKGNRTCKNAKRHEKRLDCGVAEKVACDDLQGPELAVNLLCR